MLCEYGGQPQGSVQAAIRAAPQVWPDQLQVPKSDWQPVPQCVSVLPLVTFSSVYQVFPYDRHRMNHARGTGKLGKR